MRKIDLRLRINTIVILFILIFLMPYAIWKSSKDNKNFKKRGKETFGKIIDIRGFKGNDILFEYEVDGVRVEKVKTAHSDHFFRIGGIIKIKYDSLDIENVTLVSFK